MTATIVKSLEGGVVQQQSSTRRAKQRRRACGYGPAPLGEANAIPWKRGQLTRKSPGARTTEFVRDPDVRRNVPGGVMRVPQKGREQKRDRRKEEHARVKTYAHQTNALFTSFLSFSLFFLLLDFVCYLASLVDHVVVGFGRESRKLFNGSIGLIRSYADFGYHVYLILADVRLALAMTYIMRVLATFFSFLPLRYSPTPE